MLPFYSDKGLSYKKQKKPCKYETVAFSPCSSLALNFTLDFSDMAFYLSVYFIISTFFSTPLQKQPVKIADIRV